jgi:hypothetical protein
LSNTTFEQLQWWNWKKPLDLLAAFSAIAFLIQIFISYKIWMPSQRLYPKISLIPGLEIGDTLLWILFSSLVLSLILTAFLNLKKWTIPALLLIWTVYYLQDVLVLQAWSFHYLMMLLLIWLANYFSAKDELSMQLMRVLMIGTYCWTGFHKLNFHFAEEVYPWLMSILPLTQPLEELTSLGYVLAAFELLLGLGLFLKISRRWTVYLITIFHLSILILLIADGWNYVVYTWNISMILFVWILFYPKRKQAALKWKVLKKAWQSYLFIFMFWIAPGLEPFGLWPYDLSMMMYTGLSTELEIEVDATLIHHQKIWECIPKEISDQFYKTETGYLLYTDDWTMHSLNVPSASSIHYQKDIARQLCDCLGSLEFKILPKKRWDRNEEVILEDCSLFE